MTDRSQRAWICGVAAALLLGTTGAARADVQPGETISKDTLDKAAELVSPGVKWCIERGLQLKIVPYKKIEWNKAFREATEKYAGQVKLAADGRAIDGHVAGLPFPKLDPNDPQIALKIMWNYEYKPFVTDDGDLRNFDADTGPLGDGPMGIERHYLLDHVDQPALPQAGHAIAERADAG